jgi:hypothetical protein
MKLTRRNFLEATAGVSALALAACANGGTAPDAGGEPAGEPEPAGDAYAAPDASAYPIDPDG